MKYILFLIVFSINIFSVNSQDHLEIKSNNIADIKFCNVEIVHITKSGLFIQNPSMVVEIKNNLIDSIYQCPDNIECLKDKNCFDLQGRYMIPGLIDSHVHLTLDVANDSFDILDCQTVHKFLSRYLEAGITTIVDLGISPRIEDCLEGYNHSPNVILSGQLFGKAGKNSCNFSYVNCPKNISEAQKLVEDSFYKGRKIVKVREIDADSPIRNAILKTAQDLEMLVIEHQTDWDERMKIFMDQNILIPDVFAHTPPEKLEINDFWKKNYLDTAEVVIDYMYENNVSIISTILVGDNNKSIEDGILVLKSAINSGVNFALGTDSGIKSTHVSGFFQEFDYLANKLGWSKAFKGATINGSKLLKQENLIGNIEVGKLADLVVLHKSKNGKINIRDICMVIKSGKVVHTSKTCGHN